MSRVGNGRVMLRTVIKGDVDRTKGEVGILFLLNLVNLRDLKGWSLFQFTVNVDRCST